MKASIVTTTVLGLASSYAYAYAQQLDVQPDVQLDDPQADISSSSDFADTQISNSNSNDNNNLALQSNSNNNDALLAQHTPGDSTSASSTSSTSNSESRNINIKLLLDQSNGGALASASRFLGFDLSLDPVTPTTAKYNSLISADSEDPDADVLRSGARDLKKDKAFYLASGTVRRPEPGVVCKVVSPEGELTESLPFEAREDGPVRAAGILCAETASLLAEAKEEVEVKSGDVVA